MTIYSDNSTTKNQTAEETIYTADDVRQNDYQNQTSPIGAAYELHEDSGSVEEDNLETSTEYAQDSTEAHAQALLRILNNEIAWDKDPRDILDCLERAKWIEEFSIQAKPSLRTKYIYYNLDTENKPSLRILKRKMQRYTKKLKKEEKKGIEKTWEEWTKEIIKLAEEYGKIGAYDHPTLKNCRTWEAWVYKFITNVHLKQTTLEDLQEAIVNMPESFPPQWIKVNFNQEIGKIVEDLIRFADAGSLKKEKSLSKKQMRQRKPLDEEILQRRYFSPKDMEEVLMEVFKMESTGIITPIDMETKEGEVVYEDRPIPQSMVASAEEKVLEMLKDNLIVETDDLGWLVPCYIIDKPDGKTKLCTDLTLLNIIAEKNRYPFTNIALLAENIRDYCYFTKITINDGLSKIPLDENEQHKTTFRIGSKHYKFAVLPEGYKNTPNLIQQIIEMILKGMIGETCRVYLNEILIYSKDLDTHKKDLTTVAVKLKEFGMEIDWGNAEIAKEEIEFIGHCIGYEKIIPLKSRLEGIQQYPAPKNRKQVKRFIDLLSYEKKFLYSISETVKPLYNLTKKNEPWQWEDMHQKAFEEAKEKLIDRTEKIEPDFSKVLILRTNASDIGMGAILKQEGETIGFYSEKFTEEQRKYTRIEKELCAAAWAIEKCKYYLMGTEFYLITDYEAITTYRKKLVLGNAKMQQWHEATSMYSFIPHFLRDEDKPPISALAQSLRDAQEEEKDANIDYTNVYLAKIYALRDSPITNVERSIIAKHEEWNHKKAIRVKLKESGICITERKLKKVLEACKTCTKKEKKCISTNKVLDAHRLGDMMGISLIQYQNTYIIVMVDYFSRKAFTKLIKHKKASKVLKFVKKTYLEFRFKALISTNAKEFNNKDMHEWLEKKGIKHIIRPGHYSQGTARIQRVKNTLKTDLKHTKGLLRVNLESVTKLYNNRTHSILKMSPTQAEQPENWYKVRATIAIHKNKIHSLNPDENLIEDTKKEVENGKYFDRRGVIIREEVNNSYLMRMVDDGSYIIKHFSEIGPSLNDTIW